MVYRFFLFLCLYCPFVFAGAVLSDTHAVYEKMSLEYAYDPSGNLAIGDISKSDSWQPVSNPFTLGYREGAGWFKITLANRSHHDLFILTFSEPFWNSFDLYEPTRTGWIKHSSGLDTPLNQRMIQDPFPAFKIALKSGETKTYFIRADTYNAQLGEFTLYTHDAYFNPSRLTLNTVYLFYSGILVIIILLNFFLLAEMKERINLYYIGYVASLIVFISMFSGSYLILGLEGWGTGLHTVGTSVMAFMALFSSEFLELKKYYPTINRLFKLFTVLFIVMGLMINYGLPYVTLAFNLLSALLVMMLFLIALRIWVAGFIQTRCYLAALLVYMPTMAMMVLTFNTILPNTDFTRYSFLFGAMAEIIFFSLILANRYHTAKYGEIRLQKELLAEKRKNQEYLKREIDRQRYEIQQKNAMMFQQSRYAAMGEMIGNIAHQWRQPLNILALIFLQLRMSYHNGELSDEKVEKLSEEADSVILKMSTTIDDFRNFFQPNKEKKEFSLYEAVTETCNLVSMAFKHQNIDISIDIDPSYTITGYKNESSQVLLNLLTNARDAFENSRSENKKISITAHRNKEEICIQIKDNAGGIPEDLIPKIFDPYFSTKEEGKGTGIGLYMSKTIVETHHHGSLMAANEENGVVFSIVLPVSQPLAATG